MHYRSSAASHQVHHQVSDSPSFELNRNSSSSLSDSLRNSTKSQHKKIPRSSPEENSCEEFINQWNNSFNNKDECSEKLMNVFNGGGSSSSACSSSLKSDTSSFHDAKRAHQEPLFPFTHDKNYSSSSNVSSKSFPNSPHITISRRRSELHYRRVSKSVKERRSKFSETNLHIQSSSSWKRSSPLSVSSCLDSSDSEDTLDSSSSEATSNIPTLMSNINQAEFSSEKQEQLLIFLLSRSFQDPKEMDVIISQLVKSGYLSENALDPNTRKEHIQSFLFNNTLLSTENTEHYSSIVQNSENIVNTKLSNSPPSSSRMKRSRSASSFFDHEQHSTPAIDGEDVPTIINKTNQQQYLSSLPPFFATLPYTTSRFRSDFCDPVLLGKGGFGSVFKVAHKIDGREYAIKRVKFAFKNPEQLRVAYEKVVREVKVLSSMEEHQGIVRYHNAWFEPFLSDGFDSLVSEDDSQDSQTSEEETARQHMSNPQDSQDEIFYSPRHEAPQDGIFQMEDDFESHKRKDSQVLEYIGAPNSQVKFDVYYDDDSTSSSPNNRVVGIPESPNDASNSYMQFSHTRNPHTTARRKILQNDSDDEADEEGGANPLVKRECSPPNQNNIDQPHIRNILQSSFKNGKFHMILCIQMQLCTTVTLEDWLWSPDRQENRTIDLEKIVHFMRQILNAVYHMHAKNIIHRDIKPSNVFITKDGSLKIGDFGLAKSTAENIAEESLGKKEADKPKLKRQNTIGVGTHSYSAPEQISGNHYDEKVDIFSVGVMFFEMLHPFSTKTERAHVLSDMRRGEIPQSLLEEYPEEMDIVNQCLSKNPSNRPSAEDLIKFLYTKYKDICEELSEDIPPNIRNILKMKDERIRQLEEKIRLLERNGTPTEAAS